MKCFVVAVIYPTGALPFGIPIRPRGPHSQVSGDVSAALYSYLPVLTLKLCPYNQGLEASWKNMLAENFLFVYEEF